MRRVPRAFTMVELVVAASLAVGFAAVVGAGMVASMSDAAATAARVRAEEQSRMAMSALGRYLRGARAPGACLDPVGEPTLTACRMVGEGVVQGQRVIPRAFSAASASAMSFWSATGSALATGVALEPPSMVSISAEPMASDPTRRLLTVSARPATGGYLSPSYGPADAITAGQVDASSPQSSTLFRYFDASGAQIALVDGAVPEADLQRIAFVQASPLVLWSGGGESGVLAPVLFVSVPSSLYAAGGT